MCKHHTVFGHPMHADNKTINLNHGQHNALRDENNALRDENNAPNAGGAVHDAEVVPPRRIGDVPEDVTNWSFLTMELAKPTPVRYVYMSKKCGTCEPERAKNVLLQDGCYCSPSWCWSSV